MQRQWTERGVKGAKYLLVGVLMYMAKEPALVLAEGNDLALAAVRLVLGGIGPMLALPGLYLVVTRNKPPEDSVGK